MKWCTSVDNWVYLYGKIKSNKFSKMLFFFHCSRENWIKFTKNYFWLFIFFAFFPHKRFNGINHSSSCWRSFVRWKTTEKKCATKWTCIFRIRQSHWCEINLFVFHFYLFFFLSRGNWSKFRLIWTGTNISVIQFDCA